MADYERRGRGGRVFNHRKRRYGDEEDFDHRPQRRRYEEPLALKLRKQMLTIAESPLKRPEDEVSAIAKIVAENYFDEELQTGFYSLLLQLVVEQPFKIPFAAAIVLVANPKKPEVTQEVLVRAGAAAQKHLEAGAWREFKLVLRFLACLQGLFEDAGVFPILDELFSRAADMQTASSEDALGLELVKIILLTLPYVLTSPHISPGQEALVLLDKTDIIASTPHTLEALVDPYSGEGGDKPREPASLISLLQKQLQNEATRGWEFACIPRAWKTAAGEDEEDPLINAQKHPFPSLVVPSVVHQGSKPIFPEMFFSVYADQPVETVPPLTDVASSILRDSLVDTINILDYNRNATAKFLIDMDGYFAPGTFVKRATPFDRLKEVAGDRSTWKPEDVAVDAVFSQLFQLPTPEHKLIYYHSVLTESCKIAPAAIAPSLGRAIRTLYKYIDVMDLELSYRFMDWFAHHLSNFGFTWKWTEWTDDVELPMAHPRKAFMIGALDKEIRLSFAQRIRGTLPEPYQALIPHAKEQDTPDYKFNTEANPYSAEGKEMVVLVRKKAADDEIEPVTQRVHEKAALAGVSEPLLISTDIFVTAICFIGSKSLSHVLSAIERCKERLLAIGPRSEVARKQIITSVMSYWKDQPGIGVNIIDKLLNYTILTPMSVIEWVLLEHNEAGAALTQSHIFEMVWTTVFKVTNRVRQIVAARNQAALPVAQVKILDDTLQHERHEQAAMFSVIDDTLLAFAQGSKDEMLDAPSAEDGLLRAWGERWLRVFRRKFAVEEAMFIDAMADAAAATSDGDEAHNGAGAGAETGNMEDVIE
ncbi:MAG: hypothetical protein M1838_006055 [Thelocarpon superellum]|nr:MAG: hypothetical protein M1838_006055 [Thelocarpon superellum]